MRVRAGWLLGAGAAALAAVWLLAGRDDAPAPPASPDASAPPARDPAPAPAAPAARGADEEDAWRLHREEEVFRERVRAFFEVSDALAPAEREARAREILAGVEARERDGRLLPPEALLVKLGLLRAGEDDPAVLEHEIATLLESYEEERERTAATRLPDPRDLLYQERQAQITREVMALDEIPDGLSREAYLRERLRALRVDVYGGGAEAAP